MVKTKKIIVFIVSVVLLISLIIMPVSAATSVTSPSGLFSLVNSNLSIFKAYEGGYVDITGAQANADFGTYYYQYIKPTESWGANNRYRVTMSCDVGSDLYSNIGYYYGGFNVVGNTSLYNIILDVDTYFIIRHSDGTENVGYLSLNTDSSVLSVYFSPPSSEKEIVSMFFSFAFSSKTFLSTSTNIDFSIQNINFVLANSSEISANQIISNQNNNTNQIINNQNANADKITQNQDKNTQDIIDNQKELQDKEKEEAEEQGNESVEEISGAIDDKSGGFINALGGLVSAMSYEGTECAWTFPAIKLPKINGVMDEIQLTEEQPIDFAYWVEKMPPDILKVVRAILTIGLIVYCFKELYNTISYALTLSGGGNSNE